MRTIIASARPASAAATTITKIANTSPTSRSGARYTAKAMKLMLTAFSINSTDIRISTALRRASTPYTPSEKSRALSTSTCCNGIIAVGSPRMLPGSALLRLAGGQLRSLLGAGDHDRAHQRHDQHQRSDLERQRIGVEQRDAD